MTLSDFNENENKNVCTIRLSSSTWANSKGLYVKRNIIFLRKKCIGYNLLEEDIHNSSANDVFNRIVNLNECVDGIYTVITCDESTDWETGYIDDYNYKLIP